MENVKANSGLKQKDFWLGLFIILTSILLLAITGADYKDYYLLPRIILIGALASGLVMIIRAFASKETANLSDLKLNVYEFLIPILIFVTLAFVNAIGFYVTATIFGVVLFNLLVKDFSNKGIIHSIVYSIILNITVYIIFTVLFRILMPTGILI